MTVLVCSADRPLAELLMLNLARRGFRVHQARRAFCRDEGPALPDAAELVIADLDCPEPACWREAARVRELFPGRPLLYLGHCWPDAARLEALRPCGFIRKPFAIDELLRVLGQLAPAARP